MATNRIQKACDDALHIWGVGASNPSGVANSLVEQIRSLREAGFAPESREFAPVRLIWAHLGSLLRVGIGDYADSARFKVEQDDEYVRTYGSPEVVALVCKRN